MTNTNSTVNTHQSIPSFTLNPNESPAYPKSQTIFIEGTVNAFNAYDFRTQLIEDVKGYADRVILDLAKLKSLDLSGLNALIKVQLYLKVRGKQVELHVSKKNPVAELIKLTKFNDFLNVQFK